MALEFKKLTGLEIPKAVRAGGGNGHEFASWWPQLGHMDAADLPDAYWDDRGDKGLTFQQKVNRIRASFNQYRVSTGGEGTAEFDKHLIVVPIKKGVNQAEFDGVRLHIEVIKGTKKQKAHGAAAANAKRASATSGGKRKK